MLRIGNHLSSAKGFRAMGETALRLGANTFAFFTRNPRGGRARKIQDADVAAFLEIAARHDIGSLVAHAPYTLNPCSPNPGVREFAEQVFKEDLLRMEYIPGNYYNFHPGSHGKQGAETGIALTSELLNRVLTGSQTTTVLLETMAGKGSEIGRTFEELRAILDRTEHAEKLGVCLDTCHVWDGGYDIAAHLDEVLGEFDQIIGLDRLKAVHLNDSLNELNSHKDRHAKIGEGEIGLEALVRVINHPKLRDLPFILETPNDDAGYAREIALLKSRYMDPAPRIR